VAYRRKIKLINDDKKYVWHPFTQMADWVKDDPTPPLLIERAKGNYLYDIDGKKYFDGVSSLWVTLHGHRKKEVDAAVKRQLAKVAHTTFLGLAHEPAVQLARELVEIAPKNLSRVFYSDNGSTSVEIALKMAYQYWQQTGRKEKNTFLSLRNAYHGDTIGSVSVGGMDLFHAKFRPLLFKALFAPSPYCLRCKHRTRPTEYKERAKDFDVHTARMGCDGACLKETAALLRQNRKTLVAFVAESVMQGAAGMLLMPPGYLKKIEQLCRQNGVLLICDEVATGFGRSGKMFAVEHEGVRPDFMCLSKGLSAGYLPLAVTLTTEHIYKGFLGKQEEFKTFYHGHTYTANPLACAAALANLEIFRKEKTVAGLPAKVRHLRRELAALAELPWTAEIRNFGLMTGIELMQDPATGKDFPEQDKVGARICAACRPRGLIIRPLGNVIVLMPPLSITPVEITRVVATVKRAIIEVCSAV
jgi:adenosylmethionine-8-amino-7-oxononanoate transaminase